MCLGIPGQIVRIDDAAQKARDRRCRGRPPPDQHRLHRRCRASGRCLRRRLGSRPCRLRHEPHRRDAGGGNPAHPHRTRRGAGGARRHAHRRRAAEGIRRCQAKHLDRPLPVSCRRRARMPAQLDAALASLDRGERRATGATPARGSSPSRRRRCSPRHGRSPRSSRAAAACSPWAMAGRAAMPRMSRSSSCIPSPPAGRRLPAINLAADVAMLSAIGNDLGFEHAFLRQIVAHGRAGDAVIALSTSGNSANLLAAFAKAREMGMTTIALTGGDGGRMRSSRNRRPLSRRAVDFDPPHPGMPRRRLSHPLGSGAHAACRPARLGGDGGRRMKYVDEFRDRDKALSLIREIEAVGRPRSRAPTDGRSASWKCAAAIRIRSSATASRACCRRRSSWCMGRAARSACCRWAGSTMRRHRRTTET